MYSKPCSCMHFAMRPSPRSIAWTRSRLVMPNSSAPKLGAVWAPAPAGATSSAMIAALRTLIRNCAFKLRPPASTECILSLHAQHLAGDYVYQHVGLSPAVLRNDLDDPDHLTELLFDRCIGYLTGDFFHSDLPSLLLADLGTNGQGSMHDGLALGLRGRRNHRQQQCGCQDAGANQ